MRVPRIKRSNLRYPLDNLLGSPALVRLIRVLVYEVAGPVSVTDVARMAGLSQAGARKALVTLDKLGIAKRIGTGRAQKYGSREGCPYLSLLCHLFEKEDQQYEDLIQKLQHALAMPEVLDAWITELPVEPGQALQLEVTAETKAIGWIGPELRTRMIETEKEYDLIIELAIFTRADKPDIPIGAIVLWGMGNTPIKKHPGVGSSHNESEERSLRMAKSIANLIKLDPSLIRRALQYTNRLLHEDQGIANRDIGEWRQLLETYSSDRIRDLLVSSSSRAARLRRSLPFLAILNHYERDRMLKEMEQTIDEV